MAASIEDQIRIAYETLTGWPGGAVLISQLRDQLDIAPADLDKALIRMMLDRKISLHPELNQKTLTAEARAGAVMVAGEPNHLIRFKS